MLSAVTEALISLAGAFLAWNGWNRSYQAPWRVAKNPLVVEQGIVLWSAPASRVLEDDCALGRLGTLDRNFLKTYAKLAASSEAAFRG